MSVCRGCGQKIIWIKTTGGSSMPCDPEPISWDESEEGDTLVGENGVVRKSYGELIDDADMNWYVSHFATCPKADTFRKRRIETTKL